MSLPTWLKTKLQRDGLMDEDGLTRRARARRCKQCRAYLLAGLDGDICALPAYVDPTPLSALGEAAALILGRRTYALWYFGGRLELSPRDQFQIKGSPAGQPKNRFDVHVEHICGSGPLPSAPSVHERFLAPAAVLDPNAPPPF